MPDLFVALGEPVGAQAWTVRIQVKPFMAWIWGGCLLMAAGGVAGRRRPALPAGPRGDASQRLRPASLPASAREGG
ncbi:hypothetical protein AD428_15965 [Achromobacter sp. DMS1]|nr:hypothetical protein AD428_15965 [Achromobacter sp. DMS1]